MDAADKIIDKWDPNDSSRIAVVVFPFNQGDDLEDTGFSSDLYPRLKQKFIHAGLPSQMIDRATLEKIQFVNNKMVVEKDSFFGHILWNIALGIYVKIGGRPWTLKRELDNVNCIIGLSFTVNTLKPNRPMYVGIANIFDELGEWVDITPDQRQLTEDELKAWYENPKSFYSSETGSTKLPVEFTSEVINRSISSYMNRRETVPTKIVIHKTGVIHQAEIEGVLKGIKARGVNLDEVTVGFVSLVQNHNYRLFGEPTTEIRNNGMVRRGIMYPFNDSDVLLTTTGWKDISPHSLGTPRPLEIHVEHPSEETLKRVGVSTVKEYNVHELCEQIMALTQLHWGTIRTEIRLPVSILYSQRVASLSTRAEIGSIPQTFIHRPWFI